MTRGVRYVLPVRKVPYQRRVGLGIVGLCLTILALAVFLSRGLWWPPLAGVLGGGSPSTGLVALVIPAVAVLLTARGIRFGILIAFGHTEIEVSTRRVAGVYRFGPIRRRSAVRTETIERILVEPGLRVVESESDDAPGGQLAKLMVERTHDDEDERKFALTHAYPRATIEALAEAIGERLSVPMAIEKPESLRSKRARARSNEGNVTTRIPRPKEATGELIDTAEGISITLPPMGFFKGSKGLGCFSIAWLAFVSIFGAFSVGMIVQGQPFLQVLPFAGISTLFGAIGGACFMRRYAAGVDAR